MVCCGRGEYIHSAKITFLRIDTVTTRRQTTDMFERSILWWEDVVLLFLVHYWFPTFRHLVLTLMLAYKKCWSILIILILLGLTSLNMDLVGATDTFICVWNAICMPILFAWRRFELFLSLVYGGSRLIEELDHFPFPFLLVFLGCFFVCSLYKIVSYFKLVTTYLKSAFHCYSGKIYLFNQPYCCFIKIRTSTSISLWTSSSDKMS